MDFIVGIVRGLFAMIDKIIIWAINTLYILMLEIADVDIFGGSQLISQLATRLTWIIGAFMLFKLSFSFFTYIISPDQLTDSNKGATKLIKNIIITLVLLATYNFAFDKIMQFQGIILKENLIANLIIGGNNSTYGTEINADENAKKLSFTLFSAFVQPNNQIPQNCRNYIVLYDEANNNNTYEGYATVEDFRISQCDDKYMNAAQTDVAESNYDVGTPFINQMVHTVTFHDTDMLFDYLLKPKTDGIFTFDYQMIISSAAGIFVAVLLLIFSFDIAIRTIKLAFLRIIAPIPILSYIDPKKGGEILKKWLTNVGKTYADLFIRLIAIYFAIYMIQVVLEAYSANAINGFSTFSGNSLTLSPFVLIFIIIGALMFAKQFPKLIQDILGVSLGGDGFTLNPFKKVKDGALGAKTLSGLGAAGAAMGLAGLTNFGHRTADTIRNIKDAEGFKGKATALGRGLRTTAGSTIAGATSAGVRAFSHSKKGDSFGKSIWQGDQEAMFAKQQREDLERQGSTLGGRVKADISRKLGVLNKGQQQIIRAGQMNNSIERRKNFIEQKKHELTTLKEEKFEPFETAKKYTDQLDELLEADGSVKSAKAAWDAAKTTGDATLAEQMRIEYKKVKGQVLERKYNDVGSAEHQLVDKYNSMIDSMDDEHKSKMKKIDTRVTETAVEMKGGDYDAAGNRVAYGEGHYIKQQEYHNAEVLTGDYDYDENTKKYIKVAPGKGHYKIQSHVDIMSGATTNSYVSAVQQTGDYDFDVNTKQYVKVAPGTGKYTMSEKLTEVTGGNYDLDASGNLIRVKDGEGHYSTKVDSGVAIYGTNDDNIRVEKATFESSDDYINLNSTITTLEREIEAIKTSKEYAYAALVKDGAIKGSKIFNEAYSKYLSAMSRNDVAGAKIFQQEWQTEAREAIGKSKDFNYTYVQDKKSAEQADNAARATTGTQPEGWTPNPEKADTRTYMPNSVGGSAPNGGII